MSSGSIQSQGIDPGLRDLLEMLLTKALIDFECEE